MNEILFLYYGLGVLCAPLSYGLTCAYFQQKYWLIAKPGFSFDTVFALLMAALTIPGSVFLLILIYLLSGFAQYGLQF